MTAQTGVRAGAEIAFRRLFWNGEEDRLRAGWRVLLQALLVSVPMLVIASTGFFTAIDRPERRVVVVAVPLTVGSIVLMARWIDRRHISDLGLQMGDRRWWADYGMGFVAGLIASMVMVGVLIALGWAEVLPASLLEGTPKRVAGVVLISIATYAGVGVFEESIRAYQARNVLEGVARSRSGRTAGLLLALLIPSLYSVAMHTSNGLGPVFLVYVLANGALYVLYYLWTGRAALAMAVHFAWDFSTTVLLSLETSAIAGAEAFSVVALNESALQWNGVPLHVLGLLAKCAALLLIALWVRWREGSVRVREDLAEPNLLPTSRSHS